MARRSQSPAADLLPPPAAKRPKIFRACASCVTSKTRCEDVTAVGCSLCRRRRKVCSLAAVASALEASGGGPMSAAARSDDDLGVGPSTGGSSHHGAASVDPGRSFNTPHKYDHHHPRSSFGHDRGGAAPPSYPGAAAHLSSTPKSMLPEWEEVDDLRARLAEAERRVSRTEATLLAMRDDFQRTGGRRSTLADDDGMRNGAADTNGDREDETEAQTRHRINAGGPLRIAALELYSLDETTFSLACEYAYPDPVRRGIVTRQTMELIWHGFKARISSLLPLPPFLAVSTEAPTHGFVLLAALFHVPGAHTRRLPALLNECLFHAMGGATSLDVMLSLLILSFIPPQPDEDEGPPPNLPTPNRLLALAHSMGQNLNLDSIAEAAARRGSDLNGELYGESLWTLQLWSAIVNRFVLMSLLNGNEPMGRQLIAPRLPRLLRDTHETCNQHQRREAALINLFTPTMTLLTERMYADTQPIERLRELNDIWAVAKVAIADFIADTTNPAGLRNDARCLEFAAGIRFAALSTWIPSPLRDAREEVMRSMTTFPAVMARMVEIVCGDNAVRDLATLPWYTILCVCTSLTCFRRAIQFVSRAYGQGSQFDPSRRTDLADERIRRLGRPFNTLLDDSSRFIETFPYSSQWVGAFPPTTRNHVPHIGVDEGTTDSPAAVIDFDLMDWDLSLLYPDIVSFHHLAPM